MPPPDRAATKRSQTVSTVLVAGAGLAAFGLGSLDWRADEVLIYPDAAACAADGARSPAGCRTEHAIARAAYPRTAPHYDTLGACESHHGRGHCLTDPASGTSRPAVPRMAGFLIGRSAAQGVTPEPIYEHAPDGSGHQGYCTGFGSKVSTGSGGSASSGTHTSSAVKGGTTFGGFGDSGRGFSSFGG